MTRPSNPPANPPVRALRALAAALLAAPALAASVLAASVLAGGCELEPAEYLVGESLVGQRLVLTSTDMGIHPNGDVLDDPNNPFRHTAIGEETRWLLLDSANHAAAFYAWATLLARQPTGESQFFAALSLHGIWDDRAVSDVELPVVRDMAIRGYQALLDHFPDAVLYDDSGTIAYPLAPGAYDGIVALGGTPTGGWTKVATPDGGETVVRQMGE